MTEPSFLAKIRSLLANPAGPAPVPEAANGAKVSDVSSGNPDTENRHGRPEAATERVVFDYEDSRIPDASKAKILQIKKLAETIEDQAKLINTEFGSPAGDALWEARRIESNYVPKLMISYFEIPATHRAEIFRTTGRSASYMLNERLDKLVTQLNDISTGFARGKIDTFSINLGFIDQRFSSPRSPFDPV